MVIMLGVCKFDATHGPTVVCASTGNTIHATVRRVYTPL